MSIFWTLFNDFLSICWTLFNDFLSIVWTFLMIFWSFFGLFLMIFWAFVGLVLMIFWAFSASLYRLICFRKNKTIKKHRVFVSMFWSFRKIENLKIDQQPVKIRVIQNSSMTERAKVPKLRCNKCCSKEQ